MTATPPPQQETVATTAIVNAARTNARRAVTSLRKDGLRRVLRRRYFVLRGLAPSSGRVEVVVRATSKGRTVTIAKLNRRVSAGRPRLIVRLTAAGRRLLSRRIARRLSVRAAVSDGATGRRRVAGYRALVRR